MGEASAAGVAMATGIEGHSRHSGGKNVPSIFGAVAKAVWKKNAAKKIAGIADSDIRTAKRWLRGEYPAPAVVITAILIEITRR